MKMVKSLLLGGAAGLLAVAGAQAADMPVKAKAVAYVKICSLYGDGFFYIPGTDTCLKISGFARYQTYYGSAYGGGSGSNTSGAFQAPNGNNTLVNGANDYSFRVRWMATLDARTQTEYGTLRSVLTAGFNYDNGDNVGVGSVLSSSSTTAATNPAARTTVQSTISTLGGLSIYANRAFIQLAGFTWGRAVSFYDFWSIPAVSYYGVFSGDTGDGGWVVSAYTAQFGNGVSATLSLEEPRRVGIQNTIFGTTAALSGFTSGGAGASLGFATGAGAGTSAFSLSLAGQPGYGLQKAPDIVGNLRVDQVWGAAQVMAGAHLVNAGYFGDFTTSGHPADKWGFVVGGGLMVKADAISAGDYLQIQANYTEGALKYLVHANSNQQYYRFGANSSFGYGNFSDAVFGAIGGANTGLDLTTGWSVNASYDHRWNPKWKTSLYGGYIAVSFNNEAQTLLNNANTATFGCFTSAGTGTVGCSNNWSTWFIGSRTQWDVARGLYMGVDVMYQKLNTANGGLATTAAFAPSANNNPQPTGAYAVRDVDDLAITFRVHRDFPY
jgi:hypothetical protein